MMKFSSLELASMRSIKRILLFGLLLCMSPIGIYAIVSMSRVHIGINYSESLPIGIYLFSPQKQATIDRGITVRVCPRPWAAKIASERHYLLHGECAYNTGPMLKIVAATAGDVVTINREYVRINDRILPGSRIREKDSNGRPMRHVTFGTHVIAKGEIWLWTPVPTSWDSRYYGPVPQANVLQIGRLLLGLHSWPYTKSLNAVERTEL